MILRGACDIIGFMSERLKKKGGQDTRSKISDEMRAKGNVSKIRVDAFGSNKLPGNKGEIKNIGDIRVGIWTSMFGGMPS